MPLFLRALAALLFVCAASADLLAAEVSKKRPVKVSDVGEIREILEPEISPEGGWVAYTLRSHDVTADIRNSDIWMSSWDGRRHVRLTSTTAEERMPRWSPDARHLAFISDRGTENETDQLWLMNRFGGEAEQITRFGGSVIDFDFSPDGKRLAIVVQDPDPVNPTNPGTKLPIVIDRYQFKVDGTGYLTSRRQHLYLLDLTTHKSEILTPGAYDEWLPVWSPDGASIAFVSKRGKDPDRDDNFDLYVIAAKAGSKPRRITMYDGADAPPVAESRPSFSPDGRTIAYVQGGPKEIFYYGVYRLATVPLEGGEPTILTATLDRNVSKPHWTAEGKSIVFVMDDDRSTYLARVAASGGEVERLTTARREITGLNVSRKGKTVFLLSTTDHPAELYGVESGHARAITSHNDEWLKSVRLSTVEPVTFLSKDETEIHGFVVKPPDFKPGKRYPTILRIHGGPVSQFFHGFNFEWQLLAANGYVVVGANPRGSSGRGQEFSKAIFADWGNRDVQDVLAAVDYAVGKGFSDKDRLGVGGWSYGGMLTNYVIASDKRFKAAISGSSISNILAGYGTDMYIREYELELGPPWKNPEGWSKVSYPFLHADRIATPTLFVCGQNDFDVPLLNSEQMYQALRSLGIDTQLVIYPDQSHEIEKPSYVRDRLQRYVAWYDKYLKRPAAKK